MTEAEKLAWCVGCRNNFYNTEGAHIAQGGRCWSLKTAKVVTRFRLRWWTRPDSPGAFNRVTTLSCHHAPGQYAHYEKLPDFVTAEERKRIKEAA